MGEALQQLVEEMERDGGHIDLRRFNPGRPEGRPTDAEREVERIQARHRRIVALHLAGWFNVDIAAELGVTEATVSRCINNPLVQAHVDAILDEQDEETKTKHLIAQRRRDKMLEDCTELLYGTVKGAIVTTEVDPETGKEIVTTQTPNVGQRLRAATELLDRNPRTAKVQRIREEPRDDEAYRAQVAALKEKYQEALRQRGPRAAVVETQAKEITHVSPTPDEGCGPLPDPPT